eukprot:Hpha_TRINITY_DN16751_c2_g5::TRINITY_DN16751_c2_g5_i1::g.79278::m.79278
MPGLRAWVPGKRLPRDFPTPDPINKGEAKKVPPLSVYERNAQFTRAKEEKRRRAVEESKGPGTPNISQNAKMLQNRGGGPGQFDRFQAQQKEKKKIEDAGGHKHPEATFSPNISEGAKRLDRAEPFQKRLHRNYNPACPPTRSGDGDPPPQPPPPKLSEECTFKPVVNPSPRRKRGEAVEGDDDKRSTGLQRLYDDSKLRQERTLRKVEEQNNKAREDAQPHISRRAHESKRNNTKPVFDRLYAPAPKEAASPAAPLAPSAAPLHSPSLPPPSTVAATPEKAAANAANPTPPSLDEEEVRREPGRPPETIAELLASPVFECVEATEESQPLDTATLEEERGVEVSPEVPTATHEHPRSPPAVDSDNDSVAAAFTRRRGSPRRTFTPGSQQLPPGVRSPRDSTARTQPPARRGSSPLRPATQYTWQGPTIPVGPSCGGSIGMKNKKEEERIKRRHPPPCFSPRLSKRTRDIDRKRWQRDGGPESPKKGGWAARVDSLYERARQGEERREVERKRQDIMTDALVLLSASSLRERWDRQQYMQKEQPQGPGPHQPPPKSSLVTTGIAARVPQLSPRVSPQPSRGVSPGHSSKAPSQGRAVTPPPRLSPTYRGRTGSPGQSPTPWRQARSSPGQSPSSLGRPRGWESRGQSPASIPSRPRSRSPGALNNRRSPGGKKGGKGARSSISSEVQRVPSAGRLSPVPGGKKAGGRVSPAGKTPGRSSPAGKTPGRSSPAGKTPGRVSPGQKPGGVSPAKSHGRVSPGKSAGRASPAGVTSSMRGRVSPGKAPGKTTANKRSSTTAEPAGRGRISRGRSRSASNRRQGSPAPRPETPPMPLSPPPGCISPPPPPPPPP